MIVSTIADKRQTAASKKVRNALALFGSLKSHRKFPGIKQEKAGLRKAVASRQIKS
jgi:hypothetical protein